MPVFRIGKSFLIWSTSRVSVFEAFLEFLAVLANDGHIESRYSPSVPSYIFPYVSCVDKTYENTEFIWKFDGEQQLSETDRLYKGTKVSVLKGDLTRLEVDAIVNPANSQLLMGGGVAGAILRAGGDRIQQEALRKAPISVGKAVGTTGGKLRAAYVIHVPTMTRPAMSTNTGNVKLATSAALQFAKQLGLKSVAFPGMGTGVGRVDPEDAAKAMVDEIKNHIQTGTTLTRIILVGFEAELTEAFKHAVNSLT